MPIQVVSTGHSKVMVPLQTREQIDALRPHQADLTAISAEIGCNGFYAFCLNNSEAEHLAYGRMFAPAIGIPEDPVTGNANGPLGAYLVKHGFAQSGNEPFQFSALQGVAMGRPGTMVVSVDRNDCNPLSVTISGTVVKIFQTEFELPGSNEGPTT